MCVCLGKGLLKQIPKNVGVALELDDGQKVLRCMLEKPRLLGRDC